MICSQIIGYVKQDSMFLFGSQNTQAAFVSGTLIPMMSSVFSFFFFFLPMLKRATYRKSSHHVRKYQHMASVKLSRRTLPTHATLS